MAVKKGDPSPGTDGGLGGDLAKGFTEVIPPDERANQVDSDILRKGANEGPRVLDQDSQAQDFQRGEIDRYKSPNTL